MKKILIHLVRLYQATFAILFGGQCRFSPSCSEYALSAINLYGAKKGLFKTLKRFLKCHPFHLGGYDPVVEL